MHSAPFRLGEMAFAASTRVSSLGRLASKTAGAVATFDGFAFAPSGTSSLTAGTQLFPDNSTVTGTTGCGTANNLYALITYKGPLTTTDGALIGPSGTTSVQRPVKPGQDAIFLLANPANGNYQLKLAFKNVDGPAFFPTLNLARTC